MNLPKRKIPLAAVAVGLLALLPETEDKMHPSLYRLNSLQQHTIQTLFFNTGWLGNHQDSILKNPKAINEMMEHLNDLLQDFKGDDHQKLVHLLNNLGVTIDGLSVSSPEKLNLGRLVMGKGDTAVFYPESSPTEKTRVSSPFLSPNLS